MPRGMPGHHTPLAQLTELFPDLPSTVVGVTRNGKLFIPHSADQLIAGDLAYVVTTKDQVRRPALGLFGHEEPEATRIVIAGGGNIGLYVARTLEQRQSRTRVKIIESNRERAVSAADELRRTVVLQGSAMDQKLLMEAEIQDADLMVPLTNDDQVNILASAMAKRLGCKANLVLINNPAFHDLIKTPRHRRLCEPAVGHRLARSPARPPGPDSAPSIRSSAAPPRSSRRRHSTRPHSSAR